MQGFLHFLKASLKSPLQTSTPIATGPFVANRLARQINLKPDELLIELGVGTGAITNHLLPRLKNKKSYVGFELNQDMYKFLKKKFPDLEIHNSSAENIRAIVGERKVGAIVSTLPWSLLPLETRTKIMKEAKEILEPNGFFGTFLTLHVMWTEGGKNFKRQMEESFPELSYEVEFRNIPPCRVYIGRK